MAPRNSVVLLFVAFILCSSSAQPIGDVKIGHIDSLYSKILNEPRQIWVHVPAGEDASMYEKATYPVVYLLDGDAHFSSVVGMIEQLSSVNGNTNCPKMIVVGIPNTNRTRDLTPSQAAADHPFIPPGMAAQSGGGEKFTEFIEKELIPYIDATYPTEPFRMLIGHSFGGLMVINTLFNHPDLFHAYLAIDPSMWWDHQKLLKAIKASGDGDPFHDKWLYVGIANTMGAGKDTTMAMRDTTLTSEHIRNIIYLNRYLEHLNHAAFQYQAKFYPDDSHGSVPLIATYDAIRYFFDFYALSIELEDVMNPAVNLATKIEQHYEQVSKKFGYEKKPDESFINQMGYQLISMQQLAKAEQLFQLNVRYFPDNFNVYDSLGDCYLAMGEKDKAKINFQKALSHNPDSEESKRKLGELMKNN